MEIVPRGENGEANYKYAISNSPPKRSAEEPSGGKLMVEKRIHLLAYPLVSLVGSGKGGGPASAEGRRPPEDVRRDEE